MCQHCDHSAEATREIVDGLIDHVRQAVAQDDSRSPAQQMVTCANVILLLHMEDGRLDTDAVRLMAEGYATTILRLIALEQMSGISTGT